MPTEKSIVWTGKNLDEVRRFHKAVKHYPREKGDQSFRDASQHSDNLHLTTEEGHTLVVAVGDTITRDYRGRIVVQETAKERPAATGRMGPGQMIAAEGTDGSKSRGRAR